MTTVQLRSPADLVAVLPFQLGFHPSRCLVVVSVHGSRQGLVQRIELPPPPQVAPVVEVLCRMLRRDRPTSVALVGYEDDPGDSLPMLEAMGAACADAGVAVAQRIVVRGGRWYFADCADPRCCPRGGRPVQDAASDGAVAEYVWREVAPLRDRQALEQSVSCADEDAGHRAALEAELLFRARAAPTPVSSGASPAGGTPTSGDTGRVSRSRALAAWAALLRIDDDTWRATPAVAAVLAVSLRDLALRDALVAWLCPGSLPEEMVEPRLRHAMRRAMPVQPAAENGLHAAAGTPAPSDEAKEDRDEAVGVREQRVQARLVGLVVALPDEWAVAALTVLAAYAWWRGDGALARVALDRALGADPGYRLAALLERMVDLGIRPGRPAPAPAPL